MNLLLPFWRVKRRLEGIVQRLVVRTDFPPFSWCYSLYYRFVLWVAVVALRRIPQVVSICLTGGLSRNWITYGRSDIDLMIFIREGGEYAVRQRCEILRFFFPVLPAKEVGVFVADDLDLLLRKDSHLSYRLLHAPVPAQLLYGPALTRTYSSEEPDRSAVESLIGRFEFLWNILVHRLIHMPPLLEDDRNYLYAKLSRQFVDESPRDGEQLTRRPAPLISNPEEVYKVGVDALLKLGRYCATKVPARHEPPPRISLDDLRLTMGSQTRSVLDGFVEWLLNEFADALQSVLICPSYVVPITERELSLYIVERKPLELGDVRNILKAAEGAGMRDRIDLNLMSRDISFSIDLQDLSRSLASPLTKAATFLYLASPECVLHGVPLDPLPPVCDLRAIAYEIKKELRDCIDGQPLTRLTPLAFQELTWQVLQTISPRQLATLLDAVADLRFANDPVPQIDVIVVNNDDETSIAPVLNEARTRFGERLHGLEEPRRGIPQARNCAMRHALSLGADYVAFLDDDEWPDPYWLEKLLEGARLREAALVQGRVVPEYMTTPPAWVQEAGLFDGGRDEANLTPGQALTYAATNNLLVRADVVHAIGSFDEWWGTQGGDDTEFTLRASRYGFSIVWWPEAVVHEWIAPDRMTRRWIFRRGFRSGNTYGLICTRLSGSWGSNSLLFLISMLMLLLGLIKVPWGLIRGKVATIVAVRELFYAIGNIVGALNFTYREYDKPFVGSDFTSDRHAKV